MIRSYKRSEWVMNLNLAKQGSYWVDLTRGRFTVRWAKKDCRVNVHICSLLSLKRISLITAQIAIVCSRKIFGSGHSRLIWVWKIKIPCRLFLGIESGRKANINTWRRTYMKYQWWCQSASRHMAYASSSRTRLNLMLQLMLLGSFVKKNWAENHLMNDMLAIPNKSISFLSLSWAYHSSET